MQLNWILDLELCQLHNITATRHMFQPLMRNIAANRWFLAYLNSARWVGFKRLFELGQQLVVRVHGVQRISSPSPESAFSVARAPVCDVRD